MQSLDQQHRILRSLRVDVRTLREETINHINYVINSRCTCIVLPVAVNSQEILDFMDM